MAFTRIVGHSPDALLRAAFSVFPVCSVVQKYFGDAFVHTAGLTGGGPERHGAAMGKGTLSFMERALAEAEAAAGRGEVPVGAVVVDGASGQVLAAAGNRTAELRDPTAHAEMVVIREAAASLGAPRLDGCDLYVTLEPCAMCAAAISFARVRRLYFGAYDAKGGGVEHGARIFDQPTCHHKPEVFGGIKETRCGALLTGFFAEKR